MAVSNKFTQLQQIKFDIFKEQNPENGQFDVIFEVEEKLLYAHKTMLNLVSPTFSSMLSDRWTKNKDKPIKITDYSYDHFHQFLTFLYSAQCQLTDSNIFVMVDIAEFYGVNLFKTYCDEFLSAMTISTQNIFQFLTVVDKYSIIHFKSSAYVFICKNFQSFTDSDGFLKLGKSVINQIVVGLKDKVKPEALFLAAFKWTERQAMKKKAGDPNLNLRNVIKNLFSDFLSHIAFNKMELYFLLDSVASRGYIFNSHEELSKILCDRYSSTKVIITNANGQTLYGNLINDENVVKNIKVTSRSSFMYDGRRYCWNAKFELPLSPSPLYKEDDIEWYLIYFSTGHIGLKHYSGIDESDYLLAKLVGETIDFRLTRDCKIKIE